MKKPAKIQMQWFAEAGVTSTKAMIKSRNQINDIVKKVDFGGSGRAFAHSAGNQIPDFECLENYVLSAHSTMGNQSHRSTKFKHGPWWSILLIVVYIFLHKNYVLQIVMVF